MISNSARASNITKITIVDQVKIYGIGSVKWIILVTDSNNDLNKITFELLASCDNKINREATFIDFFEYSKISLGNNIDGFDYLLDLSGNKLDQAISLSVTARIPINIATHRFDLPLEFTDDFESNIVKIIKESNLNT